MLKRNEKWEDGLHRPTASEGVRLRSNGLQVEVFTKMGEKKEQQHPSAEKKNKTSPLFRASAIFLDNDQTLQPTTVTAPNGRCNGG